MRGLVFDGPGDIRFTEDLSAPTILTPSDAIVTVTAAGLCGSDLHPYEGREACRPGVVPGHETVGVVSDIGSEVSQVKPGDRVIVPFTVSCGHCGYCLRGLSSRCESSALFGWADPSSDSPPLHGGQAGRIRVPLANGTLVPIPPTIDDTTAVLLTDNYPTAWHAVAQTDWTGGPLAVIGLGAVGLCAVAIAVANGAENVLAIDPVEERREAAASISPNVTAVTPDEATGGMTAVVEAAGPASAQRLAAEIAAPGATISIIAVQTTDHFGFNAISAYDKNLTIRAGRAPVRSVLAVILDRVIVGDLEVPTDIVVTHPGRPLTDGPGLYRAFAARHHGLIKATFSP
jgi:alcohol dehydrogenase